MRFIMRLAPVILLVATFGFHSLARESCNPAELGRRISLKAKQKSPIYNCQADFNTAKKCCLNPDSCIKLAIRPTLFDAGASYEYKKMKERELQVCEVRIKNAKRSCVNDQERLAILGREFNDILRCADDNLAKLNGRMVKSATENRIAYDPQPDTKREPAGEMPNSNAHDRLRPEDLTNDGAAPSNYVPQTNSAAPSSYVPR